MCMHRYVYIYKVYLHSDSIVLNTFNQIQNLHETNFVAALNKLQAAGFTLVTCKQKADGAW